MVCRRTASAQSPKGWMDTFGWRAAKPMWLIVDNATNTAQTTQWGQAGDPVRGRR